MHAIKRYSVSSILAMLFLLSFVGRPAYAQTFMHTHEHQPLLAADLYNNVNLPFPSWWNGNCDVNNNPGSIPLGSSYRGMVTCGPFPSQHPDHVVYFPAGDQVQVNEWECTELAMRYLYLAYGQHPYVANGGQVVANYPGDLLQKISNVQGSGNAPQPGDAMDVATTQGHVVVVSATTVDSNGNGTITVIDENGVSGSGGTQTYTDSNWKVGNGVTGWLHPKNLVKSADPTAYENVLSAVTTASTVSADNVWAVGHTQLQNGIHQTLTEHWNGSSWTANNPAPQNLGTSDNYLYGVAALSTTNVWAVGYYLDSTGSPQTLLEQYNGSKWKTPLTKGGGQLFGITAVSSSEAWAVGIGSDGNALTLHLVNGTWTTQSNPATQTVLTSVSAVSTSNVMAVGYTNVGNSQSVALVWNGTSWAPTNPVPPNPSGLTRLSGVYALDASHIYVIGSTNNESEGFITMWNGSSWSSSSYGPSNSSFSSVEALSSTNIWIVGGENSSTLVYQFDGTTLNQITSPNVGNSGLNGVSINPTNGNVWAVGNGTVNSFAQTLTEFFN